MTAGQTMSHPGAKMSAYARANGFQYRRVNGYGRQTHEITPDGGVPVLLTDEQAEFWLSGFVTGLRATRVQEDS